MSPTCLAGANDMEDHTYKTLGIPGQFLRKWSPLQRLQGNLGFRFFILILLISSTLLVRLIVVGCLDPTSDMVGGLVLFGFFFFFPFHFFFFLSTWLLAWELSLGEEGEREGDLMGEECERLTWGWFVGGAPNASDVKDGEEVQLPLTKTPNFKIQFTYMQSTTLSKSKSENIFFVWF